MEAYNTAAFNDSYGFSRLSGGLYEGSTAKMNSEPTYDIVVDSAMMAIEETIAAGTPIAPGGKTLSSHETISPPRVDYSSKCAFSNRWFSQTRFGIVGAFTILIGLGGSLVFGNRTPYGIDEVVVGLRPTTRVAILSDAVSTSRPSQLAVFVSKSQVPSGEETSQDSTMPGAESSTSPGQPSPSVSEPQTPLSKEPSRIWTEGEGTAPFGGDVSFEEAKYRAKDTARRDAIEKAVGTHVTGSSVVYNYQLVEDLISSVTRGVIEEEEVLVERTEEMRKKDQVTGLLFHTKIKAKVRLDPVEHRGDFAVDASLNKTVFQEGEEAQILIHPSQDCYIYIFTVSQDEKVWVLFPNSLIPDHFIQSEKEFVFPPDDLRKVGIRLRVATPPGLKRASEKIKVIASKKKLNIARGGFQEGVFSLYNGKETGMITSLLKELARLEGADWAEVTLPYEVKK